LIKLFSPCVFANSVESEIFPAHFVSMHDLTPLWPPIWLTLKLATLTTILLLILGTPLAWWLARSRAWWREVIAAIVALPLVLPPTVLGFYLLIALGPDGPGGWLAELGGGRSLAFTFEGLLIGSVIYSMPFVVQPIRNAFEAVGERALEVAATLRASPWDRFWTVAVPLARRGFLTGAVLGFAHTIGEFGVVLMIGGNIPGETRVLSVALFDLVETLQWRQAHVLAVGMLVFAFLVILSMMLLEKRLGRRGL
jgi:molybdate transport system permease protein